MLPPVSEPSAAIASSAATAAAEPPDEPPGTRSSDHGLWVGKKAECSVEESMANSSMFVLPTITAPASRSRSTTWASYGGTKRSSIREPQVVRTPRVQITSLTAMGTPVSGPPSPRARNWSASAACWSARSSVTGGEGGVGVDALVHRPNAVEDGVRQLPGAHLSLREELVRLVGG